MFLVELSEMEISFIIKNFERIGDERCENVDGWI